MNALAELVKKIIKNVAPERSVLRAPSDSRKIEVTYTALPAEDPQQRKPDITRAKKILHWKPTTTLKDGLKKTALWYKNQNERKTKEQYDKMKNRKLLEEARST